ncbi:UPF0175 family protein [Clostridium estertheticum]|uniref:UPF0175 family protein n=1 Tax=Clostridium estertheticum TaxID=238834 RepID=UPI001C7CAAE9|nr:UPF0175 family protein [Clostridium estertheticum]MBX4264087.1 UPF0175 family protein [Clostridium estertheticum]WLC87190.1 UPF0175 family protein [Clostridium estertheticum]
MNTQPTTFEVTLLEELIPFLNKFSGLTLLEFMEVLKKQGITWGEYTDEHKKTR